MKEFSKKKNLMAMRIFLYFLRAEFEHVTALELPSKVPLSDTDV
jgi:hypothetical protein